MDKLLQPDIGLMIWTVVTFMVLLIILTKAAWKPILKGLDEREGKIRSDLDRAEKSQKEAELLRIKYETQLSEAQKSIQELLNKARADGENTRAKILNEAKDESKRIIDKGMKDLATQTEQLKSELRGEIADLTILVTEKVLKKSADKKMVDDVIHESLHGLKARLPAGGQGEIK